MKTNGTTKLAKPNLTMKIAVIGAVLSMAVPFILTNFVLPANPLAIREIMSVNVVAAYLTVGFAVLLGVGAVKRFLDNK